GNGLTAGVGGRAMAVPAPGPRGGPPACRQAGGGGERGGGRPPPENERRGHLKRLATGGAHAGGLGGDGTPPRGCFGHGVRTERDAGGARCGLPAGRAATATRQDASVSPEGDEDRACHPRRGWCPDGEGDGERGPSERGLRKSARQGVNSGL